MALLPTTLSSFMEVALDPLAPVDSDITSTVPEERIAQAFGAYFKTATPPPVATAVDGTAVPAMAAAMSFVTPGTPQSGALIFAAGYAAFWASMAASPAAFYPGATIITPPPGLATLADALAVPFAANNNPAVTLAIASVNLSAVIHPSAGLGGTFTIPPSAPVPIV